MKETEYEKAIKLANQLLDEPYADPDDDLRLLARQFLRATEEEIKYKFEATGTGNIGDKKASLTPLIERK